MLVKDPQLYQEADAMLHQLFGPAAQFRPGQYEAIESTMLHQKTLVVQKTGWGKSLIYFFCTRLLRRRGRGSTLVVSPLLVLMENQMDAAARMGIKSDCLNSQTRERHPQILEKLRNGNLDLVFVTPETLFHTEIRRYLPHLPIGLFVIDEAHCISDWGHDFRLDYCRLREAIASLPGNMKLLATTATANNRVIWDLNEQFGGGIHVSRGSLARDSLWLQVLPLSTRAERYAWILAALPKLPGSGIIYCLTKQDCEELADFLVQNGISAMSYHARTPEQDWKNRRAEASFYYNKLKVLVSTVKLGMGYDKDDISFIIHFQMPANIVSYYQQIGRAGRKLSKAYVFLMTGEEDEEILQYFIRTAFPSEAEAAAIWEAVRLADGLTGEELQCRVNLRRKKLLHILSFLLQDGYVVQRDAKYYAAPKAFRYDHIHYDKITEIRQQEMAQMQQLVRTKGCYAQAIALALDDETARPCGHCANCLQREIFPLEVPFSVQQKASDYLNGLLLTIEPRRQWPSTQFTGQLWILQQNQPGLCLSRYGDPGYGALVKRDKYSGRGRFCNDLVDRSAQVLKPFLAKNQITQITCVPSLRSDLVQNFAKRLARRCHVRFSVLLQKHRSPQQKDMENSFYQCSNAWHSFSVLEDAKIEPRILLVDDIVDSGWTLTVCGHLLLERGCQSVYPYALADSHQISF